MAIIFKDNPTRKLTEEKGKHVRKELIKLIDMFPSQSEARGPQFNRSGMDKGIFKITCADQASLDWLNESISRIESVGGCEFQVIELSKLHRQNSVRVWLPHNFSEPKVVLGRLAKQNRGLNTSKWRLLHRGENPDGQLLILGVDDASLETLRHLNGRVHLELGKVTFMLPSQGQEGSS